MNPYEQTYEKSTESNQSVPNWRNEVKVKGPTFKLGKDESKIVTFLDEGVEAMGKKFGTEERSVPQVEFQIEDSDHVAYTWYVKKTHASTLAQILKMGLPLTGRRAKVTKIGEGLKTRYVVIEMTTEE